MKPSAAAVGLMASILLLNSFNKHVTSFVQNGIGKSARRLDSTKFGATSNAQSNFLSVEDSLKLHEQSLSGKSNVRFIDGSWYHKGETNGREDFMTGPRILGSSYFDMADIACHKDLFPDLNPSSIGMMQPPASLMASWMDFHKIGESDHVIVYGREGSYFMPRVWFSLKLFGHKNVSLMNGSLAEWIEKGGQTDTKPLDSLPAATDFDLDSSPRYQAAADGSTVDSKYMLSLFDTENSNDVTLIDARGSSFARAGHMPGAIHVPYSSLSDPASSTRLKPRDELAQIFLDKGVDPTSDKTVVCTCGSGVSACTLYLALMECGRRSNQETYVYDGSWAEWKTLPDAPKVLPVPSN